MYLISAILASVLLALSIFAYKKKYVKKILYAVFAFLFFSVYLFFEGFENFLEFLQPSSGIDLIAASLTTIGLIFFFLAIIKK